MGLFTFRSANKINGADVLPESNNHSEDQPDVQQHLFVDESDPYESFSANGSSDDSADFESIYAFLQEDYESKGFDDALTNPDASYRTDNIKLYKQDLDILIQKVTTRYEDLLREMDFHISSRQRAGLIDIVEELSSKRQTLTEHMRKVEAISNDARNDQGMCQRMILSYSRGFMRGLAAITQARFLNTQNN